MSSNICHPIFKGNSKFAYRDPAAIYVNGLFHLFMTESEIEDGYMYNRVVHSFSTDLLNWTSPIPITPKDKNLNYCSPGSILKVDGKYILCFCSYPLPDPISKRWIATEDARLFISETIDFSSFSSPKPLFPKPNISISEQGRMIDPFLFFDTRNQGMYRLYFRQNGVSSSHSFDLHNWVFDGFCEGGENACVLPFQEKFLLIHSPSDGIGIKESDDLNSWKDVGTLFLDRKNWDWASGRLTAGFAMPLPEGFDATYVLFFHGSRAEAFPETHGAASVALALTNDFKTFRYLS